MFYLLIYSEKGQGVANSLPIPKTSSGPKGGLQTTPLFFIYPSQLEHSRMFLAND